jgi:RNA polymerase sigma-70 factor (ECF subfamily)
MRELDDNELLLLLKKGSLDAYEILFVRYYKLLCLQAIFLVDDEAKAQDLVQELFIEIWDKKLYRHINQSLKAYLYRAVRNKCINEIKSRKLVSQKISEYWQYRQRKSEPVWMEQRELSSNINSVLQEFPPQRLRAFTLVYMENKKYQEAADEMGVSINSVKTHLKLALQVLRERLEIFR